MTAKTRDAGLDALLDLHGQVLVVDEAAGYWVKFIARRVPVSRAKPHGLDYSLTLHDASGERLVGFDNAHAPKKRKSGKYDHRHRLKNVKPYEYKNAASSIRARLE